ncbi:MAG: hypothetical protein HRS57_02385, partial [Mycoplasmataceae bacterium]|nr:hypothetical protein [Mycoplasmataceae bacterium]
MIDKHEIGSESIEILIKDLSIEDAILRYVSEISEESKIELLLLDKISRVNFNNAIVNNDQKYIYWSINKEEQTTQDDLVNFIVKDIFSYLSLDYDDFKNDIYTVSDRKYEIKKGVINTNSLSSQSVMSELNLFLDNISGTSLESNPEINSIKKATQEEIKKLREKEKKLKLFISKKTDLVADSIDKKITTFEDELGKDKESTEKKILKKVHNENLSNVKKEEKEKIAYENLKNKASEERILKNSIANKLIINLHTNAILKYGNEINSVNSEIKRSISKAMLIEDELIRDETIASIKKLAKEKVTSIESRRDAFIKSERVKIIHDQSIMTKSEKELSSLISSNEEMIKNEINNINIEIKKIIDEHDIYLPVVRDSLDGYDNKTLKKWRDLYSLAKLKVSIINEQNKVEIAKKNAFNNYNDVIDGLSDDSDYTKKEEKVKEYLSGEKKKIKLEKKVAKVDKKKSQKTAKSDIKKRKIELKKEKTDDSESNTNVKEQSTLDKIDASHSKKIEKIESKKATKENNKKLKEEAKVKKQNNKKEIKDLKLHLKEKSKYQNIEGNVNTEIKNDNLKKDVKEFKKVVNDINQIEKENKNNKDVKILKEQNDDIMMTIDLSI